MWNSISAIQGKRTVVAALLGGAFWVGLTPLCGQTAISGSGASFPAPVYSTWLKTYQQSRHGVQISYFPIGSGGGIRGILAGTVDFAGSDGPLNDKQLQGYREAHGFGILHVATVLGAAVPAYNLPGMGELNFTPEILAGIYLGSITKWDDPLLREANPKANLPSTTIVVLHRSEGSGTTYVWSDYLSKVSEVWKRKAGSGFSVNWPVGLAARGNEGVADLIARTPNALGYVELSYALQRRLNFGRVRNAAGNFVQAGLSSVEAAAAGVSPSDSTDFRFSVTNAAGKDAFPITSFSWLLIPAKIADAGKRKELTDFLAWALTDGQGLAEQLSYGRLPAGLAAKELSAVSKIQ